MAALGFPSLPFDVLDCVFEYLDRMSLACLCLVSRDINEITTPFLYREMVWGPAPKPPWTSTYRVEYRYRTNMYALPVIQAFHRRPSLRSYVRIVIMNLYKLDWKEEATHQFLRYTCYQLSLLRSVVKLEWRQHNTFDVLQPIVFMQFVSVMERMNSLQEVVFPNVYAGIHLSSSLIKRLKRISVSSNTLESASLLAPPWCLSIAPHIEALQVRNGFISIKFLLEFRQLRSLHLYFPLDPNQLISSIGKLSELRELRIPLRIPVQDEWQLHMPDPAFLPKLKFLCIELRERSPYDKTSVSSLRRFYECVASNSKCLKDVHILLNFDIELDHIMHGNKLLTDLLHFHGSHLRSIRLDTLCIAPQSFIDLSLRCPQLQELEMFVQGGEPFRGLPILRGMSCLAVLRIAVEDHTCAPTDREIRCFMTQELPQLRRLHLLPQGGIKGLWENKWVYNAGLPTRVILASVDTGKYDNGAVDI